MVNLKKKLEQGQRYAAAPGARYGDKQAQVIGRELEAMADQQIAITPDAIVARARNKQSPLHGYFEWDEAKAAFAWRKFQARDLVNHLEIVVVRPEGEQRVKAQFSVVRVAAEPPDEDVPEYVSVCAVQNSPVLREQIVRQAAQELRSWTAKYQSVGLTEFTPVFEMANTLDV